jgi:hypothetical protein
MNRCPFCRTTYCHSLNSENRYSNHDFDKCQADDKVRPLIADALDWIGFPSDSLVDRCDNGSAYVGLTQILPPGAINPVSLRSGAAL